MSRDVMEYDVVIVGAGCAGLAAAIRLKQLSIQQNISITVCVLEKGSTVGAHILSGAVIEPRALDELLPDWRNLGAPINTPVTEDYFYFLTAKKAFRLPTPPQMHNQGNFIISLGKLCRFLAAQAEALGVEIYPGFPAVEILYNDTGAVSGVATGDMGISKTGEKTANFQSGIELHAKQTLFAEGCRGSLTKQLFTKFNLTQHCDPQTYGLGIKELWEIDPANHRSGLVIHSVGWPLDQQTYGGSFLYHLEKNQVAVGFVVGLDYTNPTLNPFAEMQRFKTHPAISPTFINGKRISYGARALNEGGYQSVPKLTFSGGMIIGDAAGFLNVPKIKGSHTAIKSGILAAETIINAAKTDLASVELTAYESTLKKSWLWDELYNARNIRPAFKWGLYAGLTYSAIDTYLLRNRAPWTLHSTHADNICLKPLKDVKKINYPPADGKITFDKLSSVYLSNTLHTENQLCHLQLKDPQKAIAVNLKIYGGVEQYYCPASVYEFLEKDKKPFLQINAANCVHCKTCDIKDPTQNITWVPPEGGGGPNYEEM